MGIFYIRGGVAEACGFGDGPPASQGTKERDVFAEVRFSVRIQTLLLSNFKNTTGITGLWQQSVHSDVALNSSMSALPITVSQKSPNVKYEYKLKFF